MDGSGVVGLASEGGGLLVCCPVRGNQGTRLCRHHVGGNIAMLMALYTCLKIRLGDETPSM